MSPSSLLLTFTIHNVKGSLSGVSLLSLSLPLSPGFKSGLLLQNAVNIIMDRIASKVAATHNTCYFRRDQRHLELPTSTAESAGRRMRGRVRVTGYDML
jgi:hypothetical protein